MKDRWRGARHGGLIRGSVRLNAKCTGLGVASVVFHGQGAVFIIYLSVNIIDLRRTTVGWCPYLRVLVLIPFVDFL